MRCQGLRRIVNICGSKNFFSQNLTNRSTDIKGMPVTFVKLFIGNFYYNFKVDFQS